MKKVLIFGVAGFVGNYLIQEFSDACNEYEIYGSDLTDQYQNTLLTEYFSCNLLNAQKINEMMQKVQPDYVINLAALSSVALSWKQPREAIEINVIGSLNILEAAMQLEQIPAILLIGSSEEYEISDTPLCEKDKLSANNPYGISKVALEQFAELYRKKYGCRIYFTRSFNHTGVGQKDTFVVPSFCKQVAMIEKQGKAGVMKVGNLSAYRDISDVRDVVRAYRMILESNSEEKVFNVGSGTAVQMEEILHYIISLCKYEVTVELDPDRLRPSDNPYICCDNKRLRQETGWKPEYTIKETIANMYQSYLA